MSANESSEYVNYPILDNDGMMYNIIVRADEVATLDMCK